MTPTQARDENKARNWLFAALLIFVALQVYFVQEILAALVLFTVIFAAVAAVALALYLVDRAGQWSISWASQFLGPAMRWAQMAWHLAAEADPKTITSSTLGAEPKVHHRN